MKTEVVYVSPLKGPQQRHPAESANAAARKLLSSRQKNWLPALPHSHGCPDRRHPSGQRRAGDAQKKPPHILVTTPESLYLLLTSPKSREEAPDGEDGPSWTKFMLWPRDKRGSHLTLSLGTPFPHSAIRRQPAIGLSATQKADGGDCGRFLVGGRCQWGTGPTPLPDHQHRPLPPARPGSGCAAERAFPPSAPTSNGGKSTSGWWS